MLVCMRAHHYAIALVPLAALYMAIAMVVHSNVREPLPLHSTGQLYIVLHVCVRYQQCTIGRIRVHARV